jgi:MFS family permease
MAQERELPLPLPAAPPAVRPKPGLQTLDAFRSPPFRWFWAHIASVALIQGIQRFAFVWLVLDISDRSAAAGIVSFALGIPVFFFALPAGVLADRVDRRLLLFGSQGAAIVLTALTAIVVSAGWANLPVVYLLAIGVGATTAFGQPVRQAIVPSLVERERLMNAIVLNTLGMNIMMIVGPALGGGIIKLSGLGGVFALQAGLFAFGLLVLLPLRIPPVIEREGPPRRPIEDVREGFRFVTGQRNIALLMLLLVLTGIFMMGPSSALIPQVAKEELGKDALAASMLFTFTGVGMLSTSLLLASWPSMPNKGAWFTVAVFAGGILIALIGLSPSYPLTAGLMLLWGMGGGFFINLNQTLVQGNTPPALMGRVMSVHTLGFLGFAPLGALVAGGMAALMGAPTWMALSGTILSVISGLIWLTQRDLRRMT